MVREEEETKRKKEGRKLVTLYTRMVKAPYSAESWPCFSQCCCLCRSITKPRNPFGLSDGWVISKCLKRISVFLTNSKAIAVQIVVGE